MTIPQGIKRVICLLLAVCFLGQNTLTCYGQALIPTPIPQALNFNPPTLKYLSVNSANPNNYFNFLLDKGSKPALANSGAGLEQEAKKLIHYFFIGLTLPESSLWVNLRPDEPGRITSLELAQTDMGKLLLEQDLRLKKDVAQYLNPKQPIGKRFWEELYIQAELLLGKGKLKKTAITTSNRVWIVPDEAVVMETEDGALVTQAKLKVLLESEYLSLKSKSWNKEVEVQVQNKDQLKNLTEALMKSIVIPEISKEVNSGQSYAPLRQIYHSLILAQWFKQKYRKQKKDGKDIPYIEAIDQSWLKGLESEFPWSKDAIWREYLASFQKGEYQLKEKLSGLNRMYTSGGILINLGVVDPKTGSSPLQVIAYNGASSPLANSKGVNDAVPVVTKIMKNPVTDGPVLWPSDIIIINEGESKNNNDFVIAGDNMGGIDRSDHKEYHMQGKFAEVISEIAREIGAFQMPGGRFDLRGAVEKYPDRRIMTSYGEIYITNDEILVIVDSRFKKDHAGRGEYAVYARSRVKATHELTELKGWAEFAIKKGLTTEEEMLRGQADLGQILRSYMNGIGENLTLEQLVNRRQEIFHERDGLHQQGLEAERRLQQEQSPQHGKFAIIIYADKSTDWNGALSGLVELREELERRGYTVKNTRVDSIDSLIEKVEFYSTERAPDLLVIGAHGTRGSMHLGNGSDGYLTLQNVGKLRRIRSRLAEGGTIVLQSCSTARGEGFEDNMANAFSDIFPQAEHIFAPRVPAGPRFIFDVNNQVSGIKYGNYEGAGVVTSVNLRTFDSNLTERGYDAVAGKKIAGEIIATIDNIDMDFIISSDGYDSFLSSEDNQQGASSPVIEFTDNGLRAIGVLDGMLNGGGWQSILDAVSNNEVEMHLSRLNQGSIYIGSHIDERLLTIHEKVEIIALRYCGLYEAHRVAILFEEMFRECLLRGSDGGFQGGKALPLPEAVRPKEDGGVEKIIATIGMDGVDKEGRVMMVIKRADGGSVSAQIVDKLKKDYYDSKNQRYDGIDFLDFIELYMEKEMEELKQDDPEYYERGTRFYNNILVSLAISSDNDTKELLIRRLKDGYFMPFIAAPGAGELIDFILLSQSTYEDQEMAIAELQDRIRMRAKERHIQYRKEQRLAIDPLTGKTVSAASPLAEQDESSSSSLVNNAMGGGNNGSANTAAEVINRLKNLKPSGEKLLQAIHGFILTAKPEYDGEKRIDIGKLSELIKALDKDSNRVSEYIKELTEYLKFVRYISEEMNIDLMSYVSPAEIEFYKSIIRWLPKTLTQMVRIPILLRLNSNLPEHVLGQAWTDTFTGVEIREGLSKKDVRETIWHEIIHKLSYNSDKYGNPILPVKAWKQISREAGFYAAFINGKLVKIDDMPDDDSWYKNFRSIGYGEWVFQEDDNYYVYMMKEQYKEQVLSRDQKYDNNGLGIKIELRRADIEIGGYWKTTPFEAVALAGVNYVKDSGDAVRGGHALRRVAKILAGTLFTVVDADIRKRYEFNYPSGRKVIRMVNGLADAVTFKKTEPLEGAGFNRGESIIINNKDGNGKLNLMSAATDEDTMPMVASSPLDEASQSDSVAGEGAAIQNIKLRIDKYMGNLEIKLGRGGERLQSAIEKVAPGSLIGEIRERNDEIKQDLDVAKALKSELEKAVSFREMLSLLQRHSAKLTRLQAEVLEAIKRAIPQFNKDRVLFVDEGSLLGSILGIRSGISGTATKLAKDGDGYFGIIAVNASSSKALGLILTLSHEDWHMKNGFGRKDEIARYIDEGMTTHLAKKTVMEIATGRSQISGLIRDELSDLPVEERLLNAIFKRSSHKDVLMANVDSRLPYKNERRFVDALIEKFGEDFVMQIYKTGNVNLLREELGKRFDFMRELAEFSLEYGDYLKEVAPNTIKAILVMEDKLLTEDRLSAFKRLFELYREVLIDVFIELDIFDQVESAIEMAIHKASRVVISGEFMKQYSDKLLRGEATLTEIKKDLEEIIRKAVSSQPVRLPLVVERLVPERDASSPLIPINQVGAEKGASSPVEEQELKRIQQIISHLRNGTRPSLVGKIPGLSKEMEEVFRSGQYSVERYEIDGKIRHWLINTFGGETMMPASWSMIGLEEEPTLEELEKAYSAFKQWQEIEVGEKFPSNDFKEDREAFQKEFGQPYNIELLGAVSAGELYLIMEILRLLPQSVLRSDALRRVNLSASRDQASRFAQYVKERGEIGIIANSIPFDRYLLFSFLLHEAGHAVWETLTEESRNAFKSLYGEFVKYGAIFGTDFMGMESSERAEYQRRSIEEFFAENFMHFIVLGRDKILGIDNAERQRELREKLIDFYSRLYNSQSVTKNTLENFAKGAEISLRKLEIITGKESHRPPGRERRVILLNNIKIGTPIFFASDKARGNTSTVKEIRMAGPNVLQIRTETSWYEVEIINKPQEKPGASSPLEGGGDAAASPLEQEGNNDSSEAGERQGAWGKLDDLLRTGNKVDINVIREMDVNGSLYEAIPELRVLLEKSKDPGHTAERRIDHVFDALEFFESLIENVPNAALDDQGNKIKEGLVSIRNKIGQNKNDLYLLRLAILLHDVGKRPEKKPLEPSHEEHGAADVLPLILGRIENLTEEDKKTISYLVEHHSAFSFFGNMRDSSKEVKDNLVVESADVLGDNLKRIEMLYLLNVADFVALDAKEKKNSSIGLLLLEIPFKFISDTLSGEGGLEKARKNVKEEYLQVIFPEHGEKIKELYLRLVGLPFIAGAGFKRIENHLSLLEAVLQGETAVKTSKLVYYDNTQYTELVVGVPKDGLGLLRVIAGFLVDEGYDIHLAWINTVDVDGKKNVFDRFLIKRVSGQSDDGLEQELVSKINSFVDSDNINPDMDAIKQKLPELTSSDVKIDFEKSDNGKVTQMTIKTKDGMGLLFRIADIFSRLGINLLKADIRTLGSGVGNTFFTQKNGKPISKELEDDLRIELVRELTAPQPSSSSPLSYETSKEPWDIGLVMTLKDLARFIVVRHITGTLTPYIIQRAQVEFSAIYRRLTGKGLPSFEEGEDPEKKDEVFREFLKEVRRIEDEESIDTSGQDGPSSWIAEEFVLAGDVSELDKGESPVAYDVIGMGSEITDERKALTDLQDELKQKLIRKANLQEIIETIKEMKKIDLDAYNVPPKVVTLTADDKQYLKGLVKDGNEFVNYIYYFTHRRDSLINGIGFPVTDENRNIFIADLRRINADSRGVMGLKDDSGQKVEIYSHSDLERASVDDLIDGLSKKTVARIDIRYIPLSKVIRIEYVKSEVGSTLSLVQSSSPVAANADSEDVVGGIDLSQIEVTLKDEKFVSQLNPADLKVLRAAKYLKEDWGSLSLLYVHEIMLLLKDNLANDIKQKGLLQEVLKQLQVKGFAVPEIRLAAAG